MGGDRGESAENLISEFVTALEEEIRAIKEGKGGGVAKILEGKFMQKSSGLFVYSFALENFLTTIDECPVELKIKDLVYKGQIIQSKGLEVIAGFEQDLGGDIDEAVLISNPYFLYERLKKKFEQINFSKEGSDFKLASTVFENKKPYTAEQVELPALEPPEKLNESQLRAIKTSQKSSVTFIWGPPGTGKTQSLARIVECFIKRGMKVLVVSISNAAVDVATEYIAEILKETEYYRDGKIIRLGNYQRKTLEMQYELTILSKLVEKHEEPLNQEKLDLEQKKSTIEKEVVESEKIIKDVEQELSKVSQTEEKIQKRDNILKLINDFMEREASIGSQIEEIKGSLYHKENERITINAKMRLIKSKGEVRRFFSRLELNKIEKNLNEVNKQIGSLKSQLKEKQSEHSTNYKERKKEEDNLKSIRAEINKLLEGLSLSELNLKPRKNSLISENSKLAERVKELNAELNKINFRINEINDELTKVEDQILSEASVVCTTLAKTTSEKLPNFDALVVDEASMAPIPYIYWALGLCRVAGVIIGDFLQLPPICISEEDTAKKWLGRNVYQYLNLDNVHIAMNDERVCLLDTQYRMNPHISSVPNQLFYNEVLRDGSDTNEEVIFDELSSSPLTIIDTSAGFPWCNKLKAGSRFNLYHAILTATAAKRMLEGDNEVGIITPYAPQARLIGKILKDMNLQRRIQVSTIHRFQGGEADAIIFDTVESPGIKVSPMLDDMHEDSNASLLLNVALTRAKCKFVLVANLNFLKSQLPEEASLDKIISLFEQRGQCIGCQEVMKSYFIRDFEKWVEKLSSESASEPPGDVFTNRSFYKGFFEDLKDAKEELIIVSPYVSYHRIHRSKFIEIFRLLIKKGIRVYTVIRPLYEVSSDPEQINKLKEIIKQMRDVGVEIEERKQIHDKVAVIDRKTLWLSSLNILSHRDTSETMMRFSSTEAVDEFLKRFEIGSSKDITTTKECPECRQSMRLKTYKGQPYLSCPDCLKRCEISSSDKITAQEPCPQCSQPMVLRHSSKGFFLGCSNYPYCKKTISLN